MSESFQNALPRLRPWMLALGALLGGCIDTMSVGRSPLATVDASVTADEDARVREGGVRDAGSRADSGTRPGEAGVLDAGDTKAPDAEVADASIRDAAVSDAGTDAGTADAGLGRCEPALCAIAGISPRDDTCPDGQSSACLREESGQCFWYCL